MQKNWGQSKKIKILRFRNLLPTRLCRAATTNPGQIERSSFFLLDHNDKTRIYRLVPGSFDVPLRRKRDSPMGYDDCPPPPPRQLGLNILKLHYHSVTVNADYDLILISKILESFHLMTWHSPLNINFLTLVSSKKRFQSCVLHILKLTYASFTYFLFYCSLNINIWPCSVLKCWLVFGTSGLNQNVTIDLDIDFGR